MVVEEVAVVPAPPVPPWCVVAGGVVPPGFLETAVTGAVVVVVDVAVAVAVAGVVVVVVSAQVGTEITLSFSVTAPVCAKTRPSTLAPESSVTEAKARMVPTKEVVLPRVAELPTCQ
jgi:hypothetical protein